MIFKLTNHVKEQMARRTMRSTLLEQVLNDTQQIFVKKVNLKAYQSIVSFDDGRSFLLRAIINDTITLAVVVTINFTHFTFN